MVTASLVSHAETATGWQEQKNDKETHLVSSNWPPSGCGVWSRAVFNPSWAMFGKFLKNAYTIHDIKKCAKCAKYVSTIEQQDLENRCCRESLA